MNPIHGKIYACTSAEEYGALTRGVMKALGLSDATVDEVIDGRTLSESWSGEYLPS